MGGLTPSQLPVSLALPLTEPASADSIDWLACSWSNEHRLSLSQHPHCPFPKRNRGLVGLAGTEHFAARPLYDMTVHWQNYWLSLPLWFINYSKYRYRRETLRIYNKPSFGIQTHFVQAYGPVFQAEWYRFVLKKNKKKNFMGRFSVTVWM